MSNYSLGEAVLGTAVDLSGMKKGLDQGEKQAKTKFGKMGGVLQTALGTALGFGAAQLPGMIADIGGAFVDMVGDAAQVEQVANTFDKLNESIGATSETMLADLRQATRGMVQDADLMQASNKFVAMGLAASSEEAAQLAEIATQLGMAMGEDATSSMENFALMLANQSIPRLDSFGMSSGKARARIDELMDSTEGMTREQAFMRAVMEQAQVTMARVGEQGEGSAATMARLKAGFENAKLAIGKSFLPLLDKALDALDALVVKYGPLVQEWAAKIGEWIEKIWDMAGPVFERLKSFFSNDGPGMLSEFSGRVRSLLGPVISFMQEQFAWIVDWVRENWPLIQATIETVMAAVKTVVAAVLGAIRAFWQEHGDKIMVIVDSVWTIVKTVIETTLKTIFDIIKFIMQLITGDWEGAWETLRGIVDRIGQAIVTIVGSLWDGIVAAFNIGLDLLADAWDRAWSKFKEIGSNIVEGIKQGINDAWQAFVDWIHAKIEGFVNGWKAALGIGSPSTVFASIGENTMRGMALGLSRGLMDLPLNVMDVGAAVSASTEVRHDHWNLTINTAAQAEDVQSSYAMMRALAGA